MAPPKAVAQKYVLAASNCIPQQEKKLLHDQPSANNGAHIVAKEFKVVHVGARYGPGGEDALVDVPDPIDHRHGNNRQAATFRHASVGTERVTNVALYREEALRAVEVALPRIKKSGWKPQMLSDPEKGSSRDVLKGFDQVGHTSDERLGLLQGAFNQGLGPMPKITCFAAR